MSTEQDLVARRRARVHPVDEMLPIPKLAAYEFQHVEATGMSSLDEETLEDVRELAVAYREHFGFPLIVSARDVVDRYARMLSSRGRGWRTRRRWREGQR